MNSRLAVELVCLLVAAAVLAPPAGAAQGTLTVFAASSLQDVFREIAEAFQVEHPGRSVALSLAGSQILRTQIEQGARADLIASADSSHVLALQRAGLVIDPVVFAGNAITVVVPNKNPRVVVLRDLAGPSVKIVMADAAVPAGRYAERLLAAITTSGDYGAEYGKRVLDNVVSRETNVRAVLAKVMLGEADAGFVYETDARSAGEGARTITVPESLTVSMEYWIARLAASDRPEAGRAFVAFLLGPDGRAVLLRRGFRLPPAG